MEKEKILSLNKKIEDINKIIIKRNGRRVSFEGEKIAIAIKKAFEAKNKIEEKYTLDDVNKVYINVLKKIIDFEKEAIKVEEIQDMIIDSLDILKYLDIKEIYENYREKRAISRKFFNEQRRDHKFAGVFESEINKAVLGSDLEHLIKEKPNEILKKLGGKITEKYALTYILKKKIVDSHESGEIYIHDLEDLPLSNISSVMLDLDRIMEEGFSTGLGRYRKPKNILSYSVLTYIIIDALRSEISGSVGIPYLDKSFAKIFIENFKREFLEYIEIFLEFTDFKKFVAINSIKAEIAKIDSINIDLEIFNNLVRNSDRVMEIIEKSYIKAVLKSKRLLFKALEALVHNLNHNLNLKERKNISINLGDDRTLEGLIVSKTFLDVIKKGLGENISPKNPYIYLSIYKDDIEEMGLKIRKNKKSESNEIYIKNKYLKENLKKINYSDILIYALEILDKRNNIFFSFLGKDSKDKSIYPNKYIMEDMTVPENTVDDKRNFPEGRGILSNTSINLPRIAIKSISKKDFFNELEENLKLIFLQLFDRFNMQCDLNPEYFSILYKEPIWIDTDKVKEGDRLRKILKHGNMNIGIVGLYEATYLLNFKINRKNNKKENDRENIEGIIKLSEEILKFIQKEICIFKEEKNININIYADDKASKYFLKLDKVIYGNIKNVTDKEKYEKGTNYIGDNLEEKLRYEGIMQKYTKGGNVTRIKMSDNAKKIEYIDILEKAEKSGIKLLKIDLEKGEINEKK